MRQSFVEFRTLSRIAYACLFGALFGYTAFGPTSPHSTLYGLLYGWIVLAFVGAIFVVIKDAQIMDSSIKVKIALSDFFIILLLLALVYVLPGYLGLIKAAIVLIVEGLYVAFYVKVTDKVKLPG